MLLVMKTPTLTGDTKKDIKNLLVAEERFFEKGNDEMATRCRMARKSIEAWQANEGV